LQGEFGVTTLTGMAPDGTLTSWMEHAFARTANARLIEGNTVTLLRDGPENFPAWLEAIASARRYVYFESYLIEEDVIGKRMMEALAERARAGIPVRLVYDWFGDTGRSSRKFWRHLREAGVDVRCFNPFRPLRPLDVMHRDHRKSVCVDGRVAFVSGLCTADMWVGNPLKGVPPWRDTGVKLTGPAVAEVEHAFGRVWSALGAPLPDGERVEASAMPRTGNIRVRIVADEPGAAGLLRLDQLIASWAQRRLWLTDAYFAGTAAYVQALRGAALDGVDVRLLVPGASNIPIVQPFSRAGFRSLLEAGVRVFEWRGPMLHAKTAVADASWARVGSTNLNVASWVGNYELDVSVEDAGFAAEMEAMFLRDLDNASELVLSDGSLKVLVGPPSPGQASGLQAMGSAGRAAAGVLRVGRTLTSAISGRRSIGASERTIVAIGGLGVWVVTAVAFLWPRALAWPLGLIGAWIGATLVWKGLTKPVSLLPPGPVRSRDGQSVLPDTTGAKDLQRAAGSSSEERQEAPVEKA
jgi:cardiolipin synthase A/B